MISEDIELAKAEMGAQMVVFDEAMSENVRNEDRIKSIHQHAQAIIDIVASGYWNVDTASQSRIVSGTESLENALMYYKKGLRGRHAQS